MKKLLAIMVILSICILSVISIPAQSKEISVVYDGETLESDTPAEIIDNRVMVPMRSIFEMFGAKIKWDGSEKKITAKKNSKTIEMTIDSNDITKNDTVYTFDVSPVIKNGRTLIPVRAVSELLDLDVEWEEDENQVVISSSEEDDSWKENKGAVDLSSMKVEGEGISVSGNIITITSGGDFEVTGKCDNGQIIVDSEDKVKLRLSGMSLTNTSGSAIYIKNADKAYITITEGTENILSDGAEYSSEDDKEKACITSRDNLEIKGKGKLEIYGNYNHGIYAADSMSIENGNIYIEAKNDGIHINDSFSMSGGELSIKATGDGIHSEEIVDITDGTIKIETIGKVASSANNNFNGRLFNTASQDTVQSDSETADEDASSKGIKAGWTLDISGGDINITSTDHAIHCTSDINIKGGNITISSENKGISAHGDLVIDDGTFNIEKATEGIEGKQIITINGGDFNIVASDDGINAGGGNSMQNFFGGMNRENNTENQNSERQPMGQNQNGAQPPEMPNSEMSERGGMRVPMGQNQDGTQTPTMPNGEMSGQGGMRGLWDKIRMEHSLPKCKTAK